MPKKRNRPSTPWDHHTHEQLAAEIIDWAKAHGWTATYFKAAERHGLWRTWFYGDSGFPDIIAIHPSHGVAFIEVKTLAAPALRPEQQWFADVALAVEDQPQSRVTWWLARPGSMRRVQHWLRTGQDPDA